MGASREWRRAADRERRLLGEADPELAEELHQRDLEHARRQAAVTRKRLGMPLSPAQKKLVHEDDAAGCGCGCLVVVLLVLFGLLVWGIGEAAPTCTSLVQSMC